jgi:hypothetical protein
MAAKCSVYAAKSKLFVRWRHAHLLRRRDVEKSGPTMIVHSGGCHCARVRFEVIAPPALQVSECNCSICSKSGYLHLIVPADRFRLLSGEDVLTTYTFNTGIAKHRFCSVCGVKSFYVPRSHPDGFSVNSRCIDAGTVAELAVRPFN